MTASSKARRFAWSPFALVLAVSNGATAQAPTLKSVQVELPADSVEFTGPGSDAANGICLACHSAEMVLFQPKLSASTWTTEVNKMRTAFKAPIADADAAAIVDYLVKLQNR
jgi:hypothetical protein